MPRAGDLYPALRGGNDTHSPLRGLLDYTTPLDMTAQAAGEGIKGKIENVVDFVKETTGVDLSGVVALFDGFEQVTGMSLFELVDLNPLDNLPKLFMALEGIDWDQPGAIMEAIQAAVTAIPFIGPTLGALLGIFIPDDEDPTPHVERFGNNLRSLFPGTDLNSPSFSRDNALSNLINQGLRPLRLLLGWDDPLPAKNLFGPIRPNVIGQVPVSSIGGGNPNLAPDPQFTDAESIEAADGWTHDPAVGRTTVGSARVTATGVQRELLSDPPTPVAPRQRMTFLVHARWQGLVGGTLPIQVGVATYDENGQFIGNIQAAGVAASGNSSGGVNGFQQIIGYYTVPAGVEFVRQRLVVTATATAGTVWFDDAAHYKNQNLLLDMVEDLPENLSALGARIQEALNEGWNAIFGDDEEGLVDRTAQDFAYALRNIPGINVIAQGGANLVDTVTDILDKIWGGFMRTPSGVNKSTSDVANAATDVASTADTAQQIGEWNNAILGIRDNTSLSSGTDPTAVSMFTIPTPTAPGNDPPSVVASPTSVPIAFWVSPDDATRGSVQWFGKGNSGMTAFYVDVYTVDKATGAITLQHTSPDLFPQLAAGWKALRYDMQTAVRPHVVHGDVLAIAFRPVGGGTHTIAGRLAGWLPADTTQVPQRPSAVRTATPYVGNLTAGQINYTGDIPWVALGIVTGDVPPPYYAPRTTAITTPQTNYAYSIPTWANYLDVIMVAGGGGGHGGDGGLGRTGDGGEGGEWQAETLVRGVDFPTNATTINLVVGAGGSGGAREQTGNTGGNTGRIAITGGKGPLVALGGAPGGGYVANGTVPEEGYGKSPGDYVYRGITYRGGLEVKHGEATGPTGSAPGGGGAGGGGGFYGVAHPGGPGARGSAWIVARQSN